MQLSSIKALLKAGWNTPLPHNQHYTLLIVTVFKCSFDHKKAVFPNISEYILGLSTIFQIKQQQTTQKNPKSYDFFRVFFLSF